MKVLCKKNYISWDVEKYFKKDNLYKYENTIYWFHDKYGEWRKTTKIVYFNKNIPVGFTDSEFEYYFHSEKEIRKLKLLKIAQ